MRSVWLGAAVLIVWLALVLPDQLGRLTPLGLLRLPLELAALLLIAALVGRRAGRLVGWLAGVALSSVLLLKATNAAFFAVLDRPFNPVTDRSYLTSAYAVLRDSLGAPRALAVLAGAVVVIAAVTALVTAAVLGTMKAATRNRGRAGVTAVALALAWLLCAATGLRVGGGAVASTLPDGFTPAAPATAFAIADDRYAGAPAASLLAGLRGKDVLVVFVESYGRVALEDPEHGPATRALVRAGERDLAAHGFGSRTAYLTSPTYGGLSWLAHSTLQSGLWVSDQGRYDRLLATSRRTLSRTFGEAGWRTVAVVPANTRDWPEGAAFYGYRQVYDSRTLGYQGPGYGYATMPDQYTLAAFWRRELAPQDRGPVMAEIDLLSSHGPWAPLPRPVDWDAVGDGSIYRRQQPALALPDRGWTTSAQTRAAYAQSIRYSMETLTSFISRYGDDDLVVLALGDHQPAAVVSGEGASRDVPVSLISRDRAVLAAANEWGWSSGLLPGAVAPIWPMDTVRDRLFDAWGGAAPAASPTPRAQR